MKRHISQFGYTDSIAIAVIAGIMVVVAVLYSLFHLSGVPGRVPSPGPTMSASPSPSPSPSPTFTPSPSFSPAPSPTFTPSPTSSPAPNL